MMINWFSLVAIGALIISWFSLVAFGALIINWFSLVAIGAHLISCFLQRWLSLWSDNQLFLAEVAESVVWGVLDSESGMDVVQVCRLKKDNTHKNSLFLRKWELFLGMLSKIYKLKQQQQNEVGNL